MFLNLWLDDLVCYTKIWSFFICKWVLERRFHHLMLDMQQSLLISALLGEAFCSYGRKSSDPILLRLCWKAPCENFGVSHHFWSLVAFLNCCSFLKRFSQFCHLCFTDIYLAGFIKIFFIFMTSTMTPLLDKIKNKWKIGKKYIKGKVKWWNICLSEWVRQRATYRVLQSIFITDELLRSIFKMSFCEEFIYGIPTTENYHRI